jgi:hypothetical protein
MAVIDENSEKTTVTARKHKKLAEKTNISEKIQISRK